MSAPIQVSTGDLITKDPDSTEIYQYTWDEEIPTAATISVSVFLLALVRNAGASDAAAAASLVPSADVIHVDGRMTQVTLASGRLGRTYEITNHVTLQDGQVKDGSFRLLIQQS